MPANPVDAPFSPGRCSPYPETPHSIFCLLQLYGRYQWNYDLSDAERTGAETGRAPYFHLGRG